MTKQIKNNLTDMNLIDYKSIHLVGIGGIGMSGLASILNKLGYTISGTDLNDTEIIKSLKNKGIKILQGHHGDHLPKGTKLVVQTSALKDDNPEILRANQLNIPVVSRGEMLALLMNNAYGIAVAGTHGKTTTTAILTHIFIQAGFDPTYCIGGTVKSLDKTADVGKSDFFIAESDESDQSFLGLKPKNAIITNIDYDHMENYQHSLSNVDQSFVKFAQSLPSNGLLVINDDCQQLKNLNNQFTSKLLVKFGFNKTADIQAVDCHYHQMTTKFSVIDKLNNQSFEVKINIPGEHNLYNALGAIAISLYHKIPPKDIQSALSNFSGVNRRFDVSEVTNQLANFTVINDYGHHPAEIKATINTIRVIYPKRRIIHLFQPHRYTRTSEHFDQFVEALSIAEERLILKTYAASEKPCQGVDAKTLADALTSKGKISYYADDFSQAEALLKSFINSQDIVLVQGAGDINQMVPRLKCW